jgi:hypothetical protein
MNLGSVGKGSSAAMKSWHIAQRQYMTISFQKPLQNNGGDHLPVQRGNAYLQMLEFHVNDTLCLQLHAQKTLHD